MWNFISVNESMDSATDTLILNAAIELVFCYKDLASHVLVSTHQVFFKSYLDFFFFDLIVVVICCLNFCNLSSAEYKRIHNNSFFFSYWFYNSGKFMLLRKVFNTSIDVRFWGHFIMPIFKMVGKQYLLPFSNVLKRFYKCYLLLFISTS